MARGTKQQPRGAQPQIHPLIPAVLAVVVAGVLVLVVAGTTGGGGTTAAPASSSTTTEAPTTTTTTEAPTTTTTTLPDPVPVESILAPGLAEDGPDTYEITYDVVENTLPRTETLLVRRPYESLIVSSRDGEQLSGTATSRTSLRTYLGDRQGWLTIQPELHRAAFDLRPAPAIGVLERLGLVERGGQETYAGRMCQMFVTGAPTASASPTAPSDEERTEVCIDEAGLVLHERWFLDGDAVVERTATSVRIDLPVPDDAVFQGGETVSDAEDFAAAFQIVAVPADDETEARLRTVVTPPVRYQEDGVVFRATGGGQTGPSSSEVVRFYSSGPDLLEVSEYFAGDRVSLVSESGRRVEAAGWDEVWLQVDFRTAVIQARIDEYSYLEIRHHDPAVVVAVLADIVRTDV